VGEKGVEGNRETLIEMVDNKMDQSMKDMRMMMNNYIFLS